jgi:hypothetical protein
MNSVRPVFLIASPCSHRLLHRKTPTRSRAAMYHRQLYSGEQTLDSIEMGRRWLVRRRSAPSKRVVRELCEKITPARLMACSIERTWISCGDPRVLFARAFSSPHPSPLKQGMALLQSIEGVLELSQNASVSPRTRQHVLDPRYAWFETQATVMEFSDVLKPDQYYHVGEDLLTTDSVTAAQMEGGKALRSVSLKNYESSQSGRLLAVGCHGFMVSSWPRPAARPPLNWLVGWLTVP